MFYYSQHDKIYGNYPAPVGKPGRKERVAMEPLIKSGVLNWLMAEDPKQDLFRQENEEMERRNLPFPPEVGTGWGEYLRLTNGMEIGRGACSFAPDMVNCRVPIYSACGEQSEPMFTFAVAKTGACSIIDGCIGASFQLHKGFLLSRYTDKIDYQVTSEGGASLELTILFISASMMEAMVGAELADTMTKALQLTVLPSVSTRSLPYKVSSILCAYPQEHYAGKMRKLHTQSKVMEFICSLSDYVTSTSNCQIDVKLVGKKRLIELLHEELLHLDGRIPTLDKLARQFDVSARVLNNGFKEIYGCSINTYISGQRLNSAHEALMKSDIPMKTLASSLGYSHVNHFITAFRKKFGYSPGSLRK